LPKVLSACEERHVHLLIHTSRVVQKTKKRLIRLDGAKKGFRLPFWF
jgi:hypothetical protein